MEKENWYEVVYDTKMDKLILKKSKIKGGIIKKIKNNRFIVTIFLAFITFTCINITMIASFMKILQNI